MSTKVTLPPKENEPRRSSPPALKPVQLTEGATLGEFFGGFVGTLFFTALITVLLPIPFMVFLEDIDLPDVQDNPLTFGAFLTGVVALVGLYYLIEIDNGERFDGPSGEAVQKILTGVILAVGFLNLEWEFLANWPNSVGTHLTLDQDPPLLPLFRNLFKPNVFFLMIATVMVFSVCLIARESLAMTPRGFRRQRRQLQEDLQAQRDVVVAYGATLERIDAADLQKLEKSKSARTHGFIVRSFVQTLIVAGFATGLVYAVGLGTARLSIPVHWGPSPIPPTAYAWFFTVFLIAWGLLEFAMFYHKKHLISRAFLISKWEAATLIVFAGLLSSVYWAMLLFLGIEATLVALAALALRFLRHCSQTRVIKYLFTRSTSDRKEND